MNVGPASAAWSIQGGIALASEGDDRAPSSASSDVRTEREGAPSGAHAAGSKDGMEARMLRLLKDGRVSSVADERLRTSVREAAKASASQADAIGRASAQDGTAELRDPLHDLLHTGLFDEAMRTMLAEVFTQFEAEANEAEAGFDSEEVVDAQQLYEEMKETFEEFHASLRRIFRLVDGPEAEEPWPEAGAEDASSATSSTSSTAEAHADDTAAERASAVQEELVARIAAAYQETVDEAASAVEAKGSGESEDGAGAYTRLAAAYETRYDASSGDEDSSFSTEG